MATLDNFSGLLPLICLGCGQNSTKWGEQYCLACIRKNRAAETQNGRQAKTRLKRSPDIAHAIERLNGVTATLILPNCSGERRDAIWDELARLGGLLELHGPATPELRSEIRNRARAIRAYLTSQPEHDRNSAYQYISATEILANVGFENTDNVLTLRHYTAESVAFYLSQQDHFRLGRSLLLYANSWRLTGQMSKSRQFMRYAWYVLDELCDHRKDLLTTLTYQCVYRHYFRFFGKSWTKRAREKAKDEIQGLCNDIGSPGVRLETHRDLVEYWNQEKNFAEAMKEYEALQVIWRENRFPEYGVPSIIRPQIHTLLETGNKQDRQKALDLILNQYLRLYLNDRHSYYRDALLAWKTKYHELQFDVPDPEYGAIILTYLPCNKFDS